MISTTDFFFPLVDDPYLQGRIACCNVLSDMYAMGVHEVDTMLMLLGVAIKMTAPQREAVTREIIRGFNDCASEAGTSVTGGQTTLNPWPIVGGTATSVVREGEFVKPTRAKQGDVLVLTKPLGTQVAVNVHQWLHMPEKWALCEGIITVDQAEASYQTAWRSMARLNRTAARLLLKHQANAATDVTGFGILGHARNLAKASEQPVTFKIETLPIIKNMCLVNEKVRNFRLLLGLSAETSGGLLVSLPAANAEAFCRELEEEDGCPCWIVGRVIEGQRDAVIDENVVVVEV
eukprot:GILJ01003433.1.p1 GENE.GILJ01003433.1~~GILJ01003433.1.p1  ORF type:complete len:291 (-),score=29.11 GILJ01003433.1:421-1293(-)